MSFQLGPWLVEPERNLIFRNGTESRLTPKAMDLLVLLAKHAGTVVSRESMIEQVWGGAAVTDDAIVRCIGELRRVLEDNARNPVYLETISRRGYRIVSPVEWVTQTPVAAASRRFPASVGLAAAVLAVLLVAAGLLFLVHRPDPPIRSLAVLPLDDHSPNRQEYFTEGMTEALITELAQIESLRVISRTSAMRYRSSKKSLAEIARELGVEGVVEGSVLRSGSRVRITAQLIHAASDSHLWSGSFERDGSDIVSLQGEVARAIAGKLRVALKTKSQGRLADRRRISLEAYDAFLIGQYYVSRFQFAKAADSFELAVQRDPSFALAYAMLCEADTMVTFTQEQQPTERAMRALQRARELDGSLAEVHMIVGDELFYINWDWVAGEAEFRRAAEIAPNSSEAAIHHMMALHAQTRWEEAFREGRRALHLDPVSPRLNSLWIGLLIDAHRYEEAEKTLRKVVALGVDLPGGGNALAGRIYQRLGKNSEAVAAFLKADRLLGIPEEQLGTRESAAHKAGILGYWSAVLEGQAQGQPTRPLRHALLCVQSGRIEEAFRWLEFAFEQKSPRLAWLKAHSNWDPIRGDPRFQSILRRMGLGGST